MARLEVCQRMDHGLEKLSLAGRDGYCWGAGEV